MSGRPPTLVSLPCPNCGGRITLTIERREYEQIKEWACAVHEMEERNRCPDAVDAIGRAVADAIEPAGDGQ